MMRTVVHASCNATQCVVAQSDEFLVYLELDPVSVRAGSVPLPTSSRPVLFCT
jgi:hypothetical protein